MFIWKASVSHAGKGGGSSRQITTPQSSAGKSPHELQSELSRPRSGVSIALGDLVKITAPQPIQPPKPASSEKKGPAWGGIPLGASPSRLQDIQVLLIAQSVAVWCPSIVKKSKQGGQKLLGVTSRWRLHKFIYLVKTSYV